MSIPEQGEVVPSGIQRRSGWTPARIAVFILNLAVVVACLIRIELLSEGGQIPGLVYAVVANTVVAVGILFNASLSGRR